MGFLKPKPATADNQAYGMIKDTYAPQMQQGVGATSFMGGLLGVPGGNAEGATAGFEGYKKQAGYAPALAELQKGVVGGAASRGLLNSGASQKALLKAGSNLNNSYFQNYFGNLMGVSNAGTQAGGLVTNAGSRSTGGSPSTAGAIGSVLGGIAGIFSDRRLKRDIVLLDRADDGLGLYAFRMFDEDTRRVGVMADEVAAIRPWAIGAKVGGFSTVHYGAL